MDRRWIPVSGDVSTIRAYAIWADSSIVDQPVIPESENALPQYAETRQDPVVILVICEANNSISLDSGGIGVAHHLNHLALRFTGGKPFDAVWARFRWWSCDEGHNQKNH
jgi:hypothetical protein